MQRREFVTFICSAAAASWPLAVRAQRRERMRLIGVLMGYPESDSEAQAQIAAFRGGLQKLGWTEGHNIRIDTRWATPTDAAADATVRERTRRVTARRHSCEHHTHHDLFTAATNARNPHRLRDSRRSHRQRLRSQLPAAGRQRYWIRYRRGLPGRKVAGTAQGDCATRQSGPRSLFNPATATYAESYLKAFKAAAASLAVEAVAAHVHEASSSL